MINKLKIRVIIFAIFFLPTQVFGMAGKKCNEEAGSGIVRCGCGGCRVAASELNHAKKQTFSMELLNLKPNFL